MIDSLLELIKNQLRSDLAELVPKTQWHRLPLERVNTSTFPCVAMYDGEITFLPIRQDRYLEQNSREFQQAFWIDLAGQNSIQVEQLTSLIVGLISLNQQTWLAACNQLPEDSAPHYKSSTIATRHRFRQIQIVGASPHYEEGKVRSRLQFFVIGQLDIMPLKPDSGAVLKTITTTGKLGRFEDKQPKVDDTTQWETILKAPPEETSVTTDVTGESTTGHDLTPNTT